MILSLHLIFEFLAVTHAMVQAMVSLPHTVFSSNAKPL